MDTDNKGLSFNLLPLGTKFNLVRKHNIKLLSMLEEMGAHCTFIETENQALKNKTDRLQTHISFLERHAESNTEALPLRVIKKDNRKLRMEIERLRALSASAIELQAENEGLKQALKHLR